MNYSTTHDVSGVSLRRTPGSATVFLGLLSVATLAAIPAVLVAHEVARPGRLVAAAGLLGLALIWLFVERNAPHRRPWGQASTALLWAMVLTVTLPMHVLIFGESVTGAVIAGGVAAFALAAFLMARWR